MEGYFSVCTLSFLVVVIASAAADDAAVMQKLADAIKPLRITEWTSVANNGFCEWIDVTCDSSNRVTSITLGFGIFTGILPSDLNSLSHLTSLYIGGNSFYGPLPSFANLRYLHTLELDGNNFSSISPNSFHGLTSLKTLDLSQNTNLAPWSIPTDFLIDSPNLLDFNAADANLVGQLPDIFHAFPNLQNLVLSHNDLFGPLPRSLALSTNLQTLHLNDQLYGFSGTVDDLFSSNPNCSLIQVWLHKNRFTGQIPDISKCNKLRNLELRDNQFTGIVPTSLMQHSSLVNVSLDNNLLQGPVPEFDSRRVNASFGGANSFCRNTTGPCDPLLSIFLEIAKDFGYPALLAQAWKGSEICDWRFVTCSGDYEQRRVVTVNLFAQKLVGTISPAFANLTELRVLMLKDNRLSGQIPEVLTKLSSLRYFDVSYNNISGPIPNFASSVEVVTVGNPQLNPPPT